MSRPNVVDEGLADDSTTPRGMASPGAVLHGAGSSSFVRSIPRKSTRTRSRRLCSGEHGDAAFTEYAGGYHGAGPFGPTDFPVGRQRSPSRAARPPSRASVSRSPTGAATRSSHYAPRGIRASWTIPRNSSCDRSRGLPGGGTVRLLHALGFWSSQVSRCAKRRAEDPSRGSGTRTPLCR